MDSFSTRLAIWLAATQTRRREGLGGIALIALCMPLLSWKAFIIVAGLCLMAEGLAMLLGADAPKASQR